MDNIHKSAQMGFTTDGADLYNKGRPEYNPAALQKIFELVRDVPVVPGARAGPSGDRTHVLELGAGTGKFTKSFLQFLRTQQGEWSARSLRYTATEPSGFLAALARDLSGEIDVREGTGAAIPADAGTVDVVVAAQAFHWMATVDTLRDVRRVLGAGKPLVLIWNSYDLSVPWLRRINDEILSPHYGDGTPRQQTGKWRLCFASAEGQTLFGPLQRFVNRYDHAGDQDLIFDRILSTSVIAELPADAKAAVRLQLQRIIDESPELAASRASGHFAIPYITEVFWAHSL